MRTIRNACFQSLSLIVLTATIVAGMCGGPAVLKADDATTVAKNEVQLANRQQAIASRYRNFEKLLLQLADYMRKSDPEKADLLIRAIGKSKEDRVSSQMQRVIDELRGEDFGDAIERQDELVASLGNLLSLLQSEDRRNEITDEIKRLEAVVKDLRKVIGQEKVARATTQRGDNQSEAEKQQNKVTENTGKLLDKIKKHDDQQARESKDDGKSSKGKDSDSKDGKDGDDKKPGDPKDGKSGEPKEGKDGEPKDGKAGEPKDGKPGEPKDGKAGEPKDGKAGEPKDGKAGEPKDGKPGEPKDGKPGEPKDGEQKSGEQSQGEQGEEQEKTPGREEIEAARDEMERAIKELKKKNKKGANEAQDKALAKLIQAKERLEEILRQLREEERELMLAALEARFRKMLSMQVEVYNGTVKIGQVEREKWTAAFITRSSQLGQIENDISLEAAKVLQLLKEEGTSVAFPIAVEDLQEDMSAVAFRLSEGKAGDLTQTIEQDIIEALTEMVEALQKEMEKSDEEKKKQQQQQQQQKADPGLVDMIGELKMLRTLQQRINRRTRTLGRMIDGEQAQDDELLGELDRLSQRQARIQQTAYDLATKRNK